MRIDPAVTVKAEPKACHAVVTQGEQLAWFHQVIHSFSTESPAFQETPWSWANQDGWWLVTA